MSRKIQFSIKIEPSISEKIDKLAQDEERTFADMVRTLIREALKARGD